MKFICRNHWFGLPRSRIMAGRWTIVSPRLCDLPLDPAHHNGLTMAGSLFLLILFATPSNDGSNRLP
jgi:hypothetical protein